MRLDIISICALFTQKAMLAWQLVPLSRLPVRAYLLHEWFISSRGKVFIFMLKGRAPEKIISESMRWDYCSASRVDSVVGTIGGKPQKDSWMNAFGIGTISWAQGPFWFYTLYVTNQKGEGRGVNSSIPKAHLIYSQGLWVLLFQIPDWTHYQWKRSAGVLEIS